MPAQSRKYERWPYTVSTDNVIGLTHLILCKNALTLYSKYAELTFR